MDYSSQLLTLINGYKISNTFFIAAELNLFDYIDGKNTIEDIAKVVKADKKALVIILDLFTAIHLVEKNDQGFYFLKDELKSLLQSYSKNNFLALAKLESYLSEFHTSKKVMKEAIIKGIGADLFNQNGKENQAEVYGKAMDNGGQYAAICIAREMMKLDEGCVLDVGGGIGTYSIQLCKMNKKVKVILIDKEEMRSECTKNIIEHKLQDRIQFREGDLRNYSLEDKYKGIIVSNILHLFDENTNKELIRKLAFALEDDGMIVFHDFFLEDKDTQSLIPSLYTLDWLMHGAFFNAKVKDIECWVQPFGLKVVKMQQYKNIPTSIIIVKKDG